MARRVDSPHVLQAPPPTSRPRNALYLALEYIEGRTLRQWMVDHPRPALDAVRAIVGQVARGLRALHRMEMVHQDLRPENIMVDATGTVRIIDLGATSVAGIVETTGRGEHLLGTPQYSAPEYFLGGGGTPAADQFALAVVAYEMLCGQLPYGARLAQCRTLRAAKARGLPHAAGRAARPSLPGSTRRCAGRCSPNRSGARRRRRIRREPAPARPGAADAAPAAAGGAQPGGLLAGRVAAAGPGLPGAVGPAIGGGVIARRGLHCGHPHGRSPR